MNPFTLMFGKEPYLTIPRRNIVSEVYSDFSSPCPTSQIYIFIGARGAGKTVLLIELYNAFEKEGWIVADVNPHSYRQTNHFFITKDVIVYYTYLDSAKIEIFQGIEKFNTSFCDFKPCCLKNS